MSRRPIRSALALGAIATLLVSATAMAKSPSVALVWTGNHGDVVSQANPSLGSAWSQPDGITDGTFAVAVYWPGQHIRSAHLQRDGGYGDWGAWTGQVYYFALGVSALPSSPVLNAPDTSFDLAANSNGWVTFWLHADNYAGKTSNQFALKDTFTLEVCTGPDMSGSCMDSPTITIR